MKKTQLFFVALGLSIGLKTTLYAQELLTQELQLSKDSKEYYQISDHTPGIGMKGTTGFFIRKIDRATQKEIFKVQLEIPDNSLMYFPLTNGAHFNLIGDNIIAVYDIKEKSYKNSYVRFINTKTGNFSEAKPVFSDQPGSKFDFINIVYKVFYSSDKSKIGILKDNISANTDIDAQLNIYDAMSLNLISSRNLGQRYNGVKRVFDLTKINLENNGDVELVFNSVNEKTNMTSKTFTSKLPANLSELQDIKELTKNDELADGSSKTSHGRFYKSLQDFVEDKPIPGVRIQNGSSYSGVKGSVFKLIDGEGNLTKEKAENLPSDLFTYKREDYLDPLLIRIINKKPYIVLAAGKFSYYALYMDNREQTYAEGWGSTDLKKFKEKVLKKYLKQHGLLEEYEKTMPTREMKDNVGEWFNKNLDHNIEFVNKLNRKMN